MCHTKCLTISFSNNSLTGCMTSISLPSQVIDAIVNDPALLSNPSAAGIPASEAVFILNTGYTKGFHTLFIINASLTVVAFLASYFMIKNKDLNRTDDEERKKEGRKKKETSFELEEKPAAIQESNRDLEMGPDFQRQENDIEVVLSENARKAT